MVGTTVDDRRGSPRFPGEGFPLRVADEPAMLVDWSTSGIGVSVGVSAAARHSVGNTVDVSVHNPLAPDSTTFSGQVQRIDMERGILGVGFADGDAGAIEFLVALMGSMVVQGGAFI
jgi:hypothetical protein